MRRHARETRVALRRLTALAALPVVAAAAALALPGHGTAQASKANYPYTLVDPGTFGGPQSFLNLPEVQLIESRKDVVGLFGQEPRSRHAIKNLVFGKVAHAQVEEGVEMGPAAAINGAEGV